MAHKQRYTVETLASGQPRPYAKAQAALRLIQEIETKGLEALL